MRSFLADVPQVTPPGTAAPSENGALELVRADDDTVVDTVLAACVARVREGRHDYRSQMLVAQWLGARGDIDEVDPFLAMAIADPAITANHRSLATFCRAYWQIWTRDADATCEQIDRDLSNGTPALQVYARIAAIAHAIEHGDYTKLRTLWEVDEQSIARGRVRAENAQYLELSCLYARALGGDTQHARMEIMQFVEGLEGGRAAVPLLLSAQGVCAKVNLIAGYPMAAYECVTAALTKARELFDGAHPLVVDLAGTAVEALCQVNHVNEARELAAQMFVSLVRTKGSDHRLSLSARWLIARSAASARAVGIALTEAATCLSATERMFGRRHNRTLQAFLYSAWIAAEAGSPEAARRHLSSFTSCYGHRQGIELDPNYLWCRMMDAYLCTIEGRPIEALSKLPAVIGDAAHAFGPYNQIVLDARRHLATAMVSSGAVNEGNRQRAALRREISEVLGSDHITLDYLQVDLGGVRTRKELPQ